MARREKYQTRLDPDDARAVDTYQAQYDLSKAEAVRRLIKAGLEAENDDTDDLEQLHEDIERLEEEIVTRRADMMSLPLIVLSVLLTIALLFVLLI
jgi:hypothetical protein